MSTGDLQDYTEGPFGNPGTRRFRVLANASAPSINAGEPVIVTAINASAVATMATAKPLAGTDFVVGVSQSVSTETTTANGVVDVYDIFAEDMSFLVAPNVAATWNTQAKYDALIGSRVTLDKTNGLYTINSTDAAGNGLVILPLNVGLWPGKVRFAFRATTNWLAPVAASALIGV